MSNNNSTAALNKKTDQTAAIRKETRRRRLTEILPLAACLVLAVLYIVCASVKGYDLAVGMKNIVGNATLVALVATGATFIFTCGSFDISLGSNMLVSALLGGLAGIATNSAVVMLLVCIAVSVAISVFNSVLASAFHLPVFIMTIAMMSVLGSVATLLVTQMGSGAAIKVSRTLVSGLNNVWFRLGVLAGYEVFCCVIFYLLKTGRKLKFIGGNPVCADLSGIPAGKMTVLSFALAGLGIGLAAFNMIVITPTLTSTSGSSVGMNMLLALVFGGMTMSGGPKSKMYAALLGSFTMAFLDSFMNLFVTGDWYLQVVKGVLFLTVVFAISVSGRTKLLNR